MSKQLTSIKICYIGGGSRNWALNLMADLALCSDIDGELVLYDIDHEAARRNEVWGNKLFAQDDARTRFAVRASTTIADALGGADFVVMSIEPGPTELRYADLEIPKRYGLLQPVGDTVGPGGIMRAMRCLPAFLDDAHHIMQHCPQAWVINYTNPLTLCVSALYAAEPGIKAFGCCHEVFGTQNRLKEVATRRLNLEEGAIAHRREIAVDVCGINHFTWVTGARWQGHELMPLMREEMAEPGFFDDLGEWARQQAAEGKVFGSKGRVAFDLLRRFDVLGAAGDRHLVEFVPWYLRPGDDAEARLQRWGVVATPYEWRIKTRDDKLKGASEAYKPRELKGSGEEGVDQIRALLGLTTLDTNVNIPNRGQMAQMPLGAVVETNAQFRRDSVVPVVAPELPAMPARLVRDQVAIQREVLAAMVAKDVERLFRAFLCDPLMQVSTDEARAMFDAMREHTRSHLPTWLQ